MFTILFTAFTALMASAVGRVLAGAGLGIVVFTFLGPLVAAMLQGVTSNFSSLSANVAQIVLLFGVGDAISILGAALLTRAAIVSASVSVGKV